MSSSRTRQISPGILPAGFLLLAMCLPTRAAPAESILLTAEQAVQYRNISNLAFSPDGKKLIGVVSEPSAGPPVSHIWELDTTAPHFEQLTFSQRSERAPEWSPDGTRLAFLSDRTGSMQLYRMANDGGESVALTSGAAVSEFHWSPDGKSIAYVAPQVPATTSRHDDALVADREDTLPRLWTIDLLSGTVRQVTSGPWRIDQFVWPTSQQIIAIATDQPAQDTWNAALFGISLVDGSFSLLVRPNQPFAGLSLSSDHSLISVIASREAGPVPHDLYVSDLSGHSWRDASASIDRIVKDVRWQNGSTPVIRVLDGFRSVLYPVTGNPPTPVPLPMSCGSFDVSRDGTLAFAAIGLDRTPELFLKKGRKEVQQVSRLHQSWSGIKLATAQLFKFKSFDGLDVEAELIQPALPPKDRKYPLILLVHGGPAASFNPDYFWNNTWAQLLAARGYEILMVNPRGSVGYGEKFVKLNRADLGGGDFKDLMAALDVVLARGETDPKRLGIGGWSYGGEMTERAITETDRFKVAVAGGGVFDEAAEYGTENVPADDEWYFGTPWENREVYAKNSPATFIRNAHTPTLILHGQNDPVNPIGQSQALYRALKRYGVETQFVSYPRELHALHEEAHQVDALERMLDWFDRYLK